MAKTKKRVLRRMVIYVIMVRSTIVWTASASRMVFVVCAQQDTSVMVTKFYSVVSVSSTTLKVALVTKACIMIARAKYV